MDMANISVALAVDPIGEIYQFRLQFPVNFSIEFVSGLRIVSCSLAGDLQIWGFACLYSAQAHHLATAEQHHVIAGWPPLEDPNRYRCGTPCATIGGLCNPIVGRSITGEVDSRPDKPACRAVAICRRSSMRTYRRKCMGRQRSQCLVFTVEHRIEVLRMQRYDERAKSDRSYNNPPGYPIVHRDH